MFEIYKSLWLRVEHIGQAVWGRRAVYVNERRTEDRVSWFNPEGTGGRPELRIHNPDQRDPTARPVDDRHLLTKLVTLSHESGHATSWNTNAGGAWAEYFAATQHRRTVQTNFALAHLGNHEDEALQRAAVDAVLVELTPRELDLIWREETRAWEIGEQLLLEFGFGTWSSFDNQRARALRSYEVVLGRVSFDLGALVRGE